MRPLIARVSLCGIDRVALVSGWKLPLAKNRRVSPAGAISYTCLLGEASVTVGFQACWLEPGHSGAFQGFSKKLRCIEPDVILSWFNIIHRLRPPRRN